jgi:transposase
MSTMPPRKRRSYTAEYKVEAAHRVIDTDCMIAEVARELESTREC